MGKRTGSSVEVIRESSILRSIDRNSFFLKNTELRSMKRKEKDQICEIFGQNLRIARKKAGFTQEMTAARANMSIRFFQDLEAGNKSATINSVIKLCSVLDIVPDELLMDALRYFKDQKETLICK